MLPEDAGFAVLNGKQTVDFLIIGGGFAGLSAARKLRQLDSSARIAVLEARGIAEGPAGRNSGFMIDLPHNLNSSNYAGSQNNDRIQTDMNRAAIAFAKDAVSEFDMPADVMMAHGKINAAATAKGTSHNRDYASHLKAMGEAYQWFDESQMRDICGSDYYQSGLFTPGTALLQPAHYIRLLAKGLVQSGLLLFENSPVQALERAGDAWLAKTPTGQVSAGKVILAVNGHAESFGFFRRRLMHIYLYASMTRRLTKQETADLGGETDWGITPADPMGTSVRRISGGGSGSGNGNGSGSGNNGEGDRILIRNRFSWAPGRTVSERSLETIAPVHNRSFVRRFPKIAHVDMEYCWGGLLCLSRNSAPAFGELQTNLYSACCQNGLGTVQGTLAGMSAAELAYGAPSDHATYLQAQSDPQVLPMEPFASIGANAYMRWSEFCAGKDL